jgi:hypothetical protein
MIFEYFVVIWHPRDRQFEVFGTTRLMRWLWAGQFLGLVSQFEKAVLLFATGSMILRSPVFALLSI